MAQVTDADILAGHPGNAPAPVHGTAAPNDARSTTSRAPAPDQTKVVLGGAEYTVPVELASALRKERDRLAGEFGSRLQQYERRLAAVEEDEAPAAPQYQGVQPPDPRCLDAASEQYNPERFAADNVRYQQYLVQTSIDAVEARRQEERDIERRAASQQTDWNRQVGQFYTNNPELRGNEDLVDAVWRNQFNALKDLPTAEGFAELARLSKTRLIQLSETGKRVRRQPTLETSGGTVTARASRREPEDETLDEPVRGGISDAIRAKSRRFRNPNFNGRDAAA